MFLFGRKKPPLIGIDKTIVLILEGLKKQESPSIVLSSVKVKE